jgi:hypothetical protein
MAKLNKNLHGQAASGSPWIYGPAIDLIVGCGAWSVPLLLISCFSIASSARTDRELFTCWRSSLTIRTTWRRSIAPIIAPKTSRNIGFYRTYHGADRLDAAPVALLVAPSAVDIHSLFDVESGTTADRTTDCS